MSEYNLTDQPIHQWTAKDVATYLQSRGIRDDYSDMLQQNHVNGKVAHTLTDQDLAEMGVSKVGDRKALLLALHTLEKAQKHREAEKIVWTGKEVLYYSPYDRCIQTGCGCCPKDPNQYKLTFNHLEIKTLDPTRCGPIVCCFGSKYHVDTIDLSHIVDADVEGISPPCFQECFCGAGTQEYVHIQTSTEGNKTLKLMRGEGQDVARKIKNQVEHMQRMERS